MIRFPLDKLTPIIRIAAEQAELDMDRCGEWGREGWEEISAILIQAAAAVMTHINSTGDES